MRKAAQEVPLAVDAAPVGAPHRLHPLKILPRILRVKIVELMPPKLRPGRAVQALPPGLQGEVAKPAELSGVPGLPWQHPPPWNAGRPPDPPEPSGDTGNRRTRPRRVGRVRRLSGFLLLELGFPPKPPRGAPDSRLPGEDLRLPPGASGPAKEKREPAPPPRSWRSSRFSR